MGFMVPIELDIKGHCGVCRTGGDLCNEGIIASS